MNAEIMYLRLLAINAKKQVPLERVSSLENSPVPLSMFARMGQCWLLMPQLLMVMQLYKCSSLPTILERSASRIFCTQIYAIYPEPA